ncbi:hypothetical protein RRG08_051255 [Elysia crispata]|uniref:Uncharacterized protein n=1 Tax=Elysia crispata TaxID=231223 RepID=A0AAE1A7A8_9GAST|nr:hypothetical protein RRG08_051255 [Elysia crispata]
MTAVTQPTLGLTGRARHRGDATSALGQHFCVVGAGAARGDNQTKTNFWILRNSVSHTHTHTRTRGQVGNSKRQIWHSGYWNLYREQQQQQQNKKKKQAVSLSHARAWTPCVACLRCRVVR